MHKHMANHRCQNSRGDLQITAETTQAYATTYKEFPQHDLMAQRYLTLLLNPLNPGAFCKKPVFWTFWRCSGWISTTLALIWSNVHLRHDSLPFSPIASRFMTFWLGHALKAKF